MPRAYSGASGRAAGSAHRGKEAHSKFFVVPVVTSPTAAAAAMGSHEAAQKASEERRRVESSGTSLEAIVVGPASLSSKEEAGQVRQASAREMDEEGERDGSEDGRKTEAEAEAEAEADVEESRECAESTPVVDGAGSTVDDHETTAGVAAQYEVAGVNLRIDPVVHAERVASEDAPPDQAAKVSQGVDVSTRDRDDDASSPLFEVVDQSPLDSSPTEEELIEAHAETSGRSKDRHDSPRIAIDKTARPTNTEEHSRGSIDGRKDAVIASDMATIYQAVSVEGGISDDERGTAAASDASGHRESPSERVQTEPTGLGGAPASGGQDGQGESDEGFGDTAHLGDMDEEELEREEERMKRESNRARRDAETVTEEMKEEVMDLLQLFGVPYIIAPMEAEAQCCELERLRLVDGTVTDDSDAFAFGGKTVYKNIFNEKKYVEAYLLADAEKDLGVGTDEVIALAMLLGSDYTEGVRGVGIVNAMEIINAFPLEGNGPGHGLSKFKSWIEGFDPILDQELEGLAKTKSKAEIDGLSLELKFHLKHRSARNRWTVSEGFPSKEVISAYKNPQVDKSEEPFSWAAPDVDGLRALCKRVLGWDSAQSDGLLMPMVKELDQGSFSQRRIDSYFMTYHDNRRVAAIKSKRLRAAVEDLANGSTEVISVKGSPASMAAIGKRGRTAKKSALPIGTGTARPTKRRPKQPSSVSTIGRRRRNDDASPTSETPARTAPPASTATLGHATNVGNDVEDEGPPSREGEPELPPLNNSRKRARSTSAERNTASPPSSSGGVRASGSTAMSSSGQDSSESGDESSPPRSHPPASRTTDTTAAPNTGTRRSRRIEGNGKTGRSTAVAAHTEGKRRNPRRKTKALRGGE